MTEKNTVELIGGPVDGERHVIPAWWNHVIADVDIAASKRIARWQYVQSWDLTEDGLDRFVVDKVVEIRE